MVCYVLASVRRLEDTRQIVTLNDAEQVNRHLDAGWKLIDKYVTTEEAATQRHETLHYVLAWQSEDPPPGTQSTTRQHWNVSPDAFDDL